MPGRSCGARRTGLEDMSGPGVGAAGVLSAAGCVAGLLDPHDPVPDAHDVEHPVPSRQNRTDVVSSMLVVS